MLCVGADSTKEAVEFLVSIPLSTVGVFVGSHPLIQAIGEEFIEAFNTNSDYAEFAVWNRAKRVLSCEGVTINFYTDAKLAYGKTFDWILTKGGCGDPDAWISLPARTKAKGVVDL